METFYATEILNQKNSRKYPVANFGGVDGIVDSVIPNSIKFRLPDDGIILPEGTLKEGESLGSIYDSYCPGQRLPFESISLEYALSGEQAKIGVEKVLALAVQPNDDEWIRVWSFAYFSEARAWCMNPMVSLINFSEKRFEVRGFSQEAEDHVRRHQIESSATQEAMHSRSRVLMFLIAMSCANVSYQEQPHNREKLNKKRQKSGKPPFYSYKILTITQGANASGGSGTGSGRSPRVHLRRGHIRRLKHKTVWVNAAVVGDKSKGFVAKDYAVAAQA